MFFYPSSTCRIDIPRLILVPSAHTRSGWGWLKKAGEYGSVRCRVLNGSKGSFPRLFTLSSIPFSIGTDILDFFPSCFYTIFALLPRRLWTGRGLNCPRLYPNAILYLHYSVWAMTFLGLGLWAPTNKWSWPKNCWAPQ